MELFGKRWKFDGVTAGMVRPRTGHNGRYCVLFERANAELPEIESINWAKPAVERLGSPQEFGLPEGYGFDVVGITYENATKSYTVELQVAAQYLGDVTEYQNQIVELQSTVTEHAATIRTLRESGNAAELEAELDAAYEEGVNSVE